MDAHVREAYVARDARDGGEDARDDDDDACARVDCTEDDVAGDVALDCVSAFRVVQRLSADDVLPRASSSTSSSSAATSTTLDRSFSIAAMFGFGASEDAGAGGVSSSGAAKRRAIEFACASTVARRTRSTTTTACGVVVHDGFSIATSASGSSRAGSSANGDAKAQLENFVAARDGRASNAVRTAPWYEGSRAKIIAMAHASSGEYLACCTTAGGVYVVPILELVQDAAASPAIRVLASRGPKPVSALWWYRALERDRQDVEVVICVGADGEVRLWDGATGSPLGACVVGAKCLSAELARGAKKQFLVISGVDGEVWTLTLECETSVMKVASGERGKVEKVVRVESLPDAAGSPGFAAHLVKDEYGVRDGRSVALSVQDDCVHGGGDESAPSMSLIAALVDKCLLELYDVDAPGTPKSTHALPKDTVSVYVTDDLIFALVREPVFGEEDLTDVSSFTARVHVLARNTDQNMLTLQTFYVPRSAGVPRKLFAGPIPCDDKNVRVVLRGCMLWTSTGIFAIEAAMSVGHVLRSFLMPAETKSGAFGGEDEWTLASDATSSVRDTTNDTVSANDKLKLLASALREDHAPVLVEAVREELRRREFTRARAVFEKTSKPWNELVALALEEWGATQVLAHFISTPAPAAPYGGRGNLEWLEIASAAHAQLHAWCEASTAVALGATADMSVDIAAQLEALRVTNKSSSPLQSLEASVDAVLRVASEGIARAHDADAARDAAAAASASVVALEAAKAVTAIVSASVAKNAYSSDVKAVFTLLLSSASMVESLHMLGEITANAIAQDARDVDRGEGGVIQSWTPRPLVFWDAHVTYYYTSAHATDDMGDVVSALGLKPNALAESNGDARATLASPVFDCLSDDELEQLAELAHTAVDSGVHGARVIEIAALARLTDDGALEDAISRALYADPALYTSALGACLDRRKHHIATTTAMKMLDYSTACTCHLAYVKHLAMKTETTRDSIRKELERGLTTYVEPMSSATGVRALALESFIKSWRANALPTEDLEELLLSGAVARGHAAAMQVVLQRSADALDFTFSGRFALKVAEYRVLEEETQYAAKDGAAIETIWSQIKENLVVGMNTAMSVQTKAFTAAELEAMSASGSRECWAFTCGHRLVGSELTRIVRECTMRLRLLDLPLTSTLLESDYALRKCALACPSCAAASIERRVELARDVKNHPLAS